MWNDEHKDEKKSGRNRRIQHPAVVVVVVTVVWLPVRPTLPLALVETRDTLLLYDECEIGFYTLPEVSPR